MSDSSRHTELVFEGLVPLSQGAMKLSVLVNGGGAVALLAFIGQVYPAPVVAELVLAMKLFVLGIAAGGMAHVFAYLTQLSLFNEEVGRSQRFSHQVWLNLGLVSVVASILMFCWGALDAAQGAGASVAA